MSKEKLFSEFPPVSTEQWEAAITADLKGADYEKKLVWNTPEGFKVRPYYREEDLKSLSYLQSAPAQYPFVRGSKSENNEWEIRQDILAKDLKSANTMACEAIARGAQGVGLKAADVNSIADMAILLKGIDPTQTAVHFTKSCHYGKTLGYFVEYLNQNGFNKADVKGSVNFDFLAFALTRGNYYDSLEANVEECVALFNTYATVLPRFRLLTVNAQLIHNAGGNSTQELGFGLAWLSEYVYRLTQKGLAIDTIVPRLTLHFATGSNYFMEIAKVRAARLLCSVVLKNYKASNTNVFIHASTSTWNKSIYDPNVNMLRTTTETMSAIIGGADSIHVDAYDRSFKASDDFSRRIARNQQIILKEESYMNKIVDPAAGSYYIENLTDSLAQYAWTNFQDIEAKNGFVEAFQSGYIQDQIHAMAKKQIEDLGNRKIVMLGTNQYPNLAETMLPKKESCCCCANDTTKAIYKTIEPIGIADGFNHLRLATEKAVKEGKKRPCVFLLTFGNLAMRKARAGFAQNFYGCAGYEILDNAGFKTAEEGIAAAIKANADIVVFCSSDEEYPEMVPALAQGLKGKAILVVAGYPKEHLDLLKSAGVEDFVHVKVNVLDALNSCHKRLGIN